MMGVDDVLDLCGDALTREPGDPVAQPLFVARPVGERKGWGDNGVRQEYAIEGVGNFVVSVIEVDGSTEEGDAHG